MSDKKADGTCKTCRYWHDGVVDGYPIGSCHRYPPADPPDNRSEPSEGWYHIKTWHDDWCGEYRKTDAPGEPPTVIGTDADDAWRERSVADVLARPTAKKLIRNKIYTLGDLATACDLTWDVFDKTHNIRGISMTKGDGPMLHFCLHALRAIGIASAKRAVDDMVRAGVPHSVATRLAFGGCR